MKSAMVNSGIISSPEWWLPDSTRPANQHPNKPHERAWKDSVLLRDELVCRRCDRHANYVGNLDVHHVTYKNFGNEQTQDGIALCRSCHEIVTFEQRERLRKKDQARNSNRGAASHFANVRSR